MAIFYAVVEGDPISGGGNSRVIEGWPGSTIQGEDGQRRLHTFLGQKAWCDECKSVGVIVAAPGSPDTRRMYDQELRAHEALGGDLVFCKCERHPQVISLYGRNVMIVDDGGAQRAAESRTSGEQNRRDQVPPYDEMTVATHDTSARPVADYPYYVEILDGHSYEGRTDSNGALPRVATDGASDYSVYWGDEALARQAATS